MTYLEFQKYINGKFNERGLWTESWETYCHYIEIVGAVEVAPEQEKDAVFQEMYKRYFSEGSI